MRDDAARRTRPAFLSRNERFQSVPSTNDIVRDWLTEGTPEVCLAVADEQTAGRGRSGRSWVAPNGAALLLSLGFRPAYLDPDRLWRLGAIVALAMADAAEEAAGLSMGRLRLKWPNDIVVEARRAPGGVRKVAGILGESTGAGTRDVTATVGIGTNNDWRRGDFPADLTDVMTSLREVSRGRQVENDVLLDAFLVRLEARLVALRDGHFDVAGWHDRQVTTGRAVRIELPGGEIREATAVGVDGLTGALIVADDLGAESQLLAGEVVHVRLAPEEAAAGATGPSAETSEATPVAAAEAAQARPGAESGPEGVTN
jgi:BirA family biotin operon repressor/biotin-[acetyl-CoA-carboxylase] ligase